MDAAEFEAHFRHELVQAGVASGTPLVVALSGGADSVLLLYLLRFRAGARHQLVAAHLDHAMRAESAADAAWVRGLCSAWEVPLVSERLPAAPRGEAAARAARYRFLRRVAAENGGAPIALAHHADDQAETVLFRVLRGTGIDGLAGMAPRGAGLVRPLLGVWRAELRAYAARRGLRWRDDASNRAPVASRNVIRTELLPRIEESVAPGARRSLVRLAERARASSAAWQSLLDHAEHAGALREEEGALLLARAWLRPYSTEFSMRLLRRALRRFGVVLDRAGTRAAVQFITSAPSGRSRRLPGGVRVTLEFDHARLEPEPDAVPVDATLRLTGPEGCGRLRLGGVGYRARWRAGAPPDAQRGESGARWQVALELPDAAWPLELRARRPGDRVHTDRGPRRLKRLFNESRVPLSQRSRLPVLADAAGLLCWVADVTSAEPQRAVGGSRALFLSISHDR